MNLFLVVIIGPNIMKLEYLDGGNMLTKVYKCLCFLVSILEISIYFCINFILKDCSLP